MPTHQVTQQRLEALFAEYSRRYFGGRLPKCKVRVTSDPRLIDIRPHAGRYHARHQVIAICPGKPRETTRQTLLHEMCHAAVHGQILSTATAAWESAMESGLRSALLTDAVTSALTPLMGCAGHGVAWQREMWRLALDHDETWTVRDIAAFNGAVRADLLARYEKMPHAFPRHSDVFGMRCAMIYFREELRAVYLPT